MIDCMKTPCGYLCSLGLPRVKSRNVEKSMWSISRNQTQAISLYSKASPIMNFSSCGSHEAACRWLVCTLWVETWVTCEHHSTFTSHKQLSISSIDRSFRVSCRNPTRDAHALLIISNTPDETVRCTVLPKFLNSELHVDATRWIILCNISCRNIHRAWLLEQSFIV